MRRADWGWGCLLLWRCSWHSAGHVGWKSGWQKGRAVQLASSSDEQTTSHTPLCFLLWGLLALISLHWNYRPFATAPRLNPWTPPSDVLHHCHWAAWSHRRDPWGRPNYWLWVLQWCLRSWRPTQWRGWGCLNVMGGTGGDVVFVFEFQCEEGGHDLGQWCDFPLVSLPKTQLGVVVLVKQTPASWSQTCVPLEVLEKRALSARVSR